MNREEKVETITAAKMRAIELEAIASGRVSGLELMERAGQGVVDAVFENWPELEPDAPLDPYFEREEARKAVVLCGPGNNGGDGFVVARLLYAAGWKVTLFLYGNVDDLPKDARTNYERWRAKGGAVRLLTFPNVSEEDAACFEKAAYGVSGSQLVIDAIFGIGLNRPVTGLAPLFAYKDIEVGIGDRLTPARHVSVDLPSGMFTDAPQTPSYLSWFLADLTVTFHALKQAHVDPLTNPSCGRVVVCDIGL